MLLEFLLEVLEKLVIVRLLRLRLEGHLSLLREETERLLTSFLPESLFTHVLPFEQSF